MEAALAMRSVERTFEEVLLPSIAELARRQGDDSAAWHGAAGPWLAAPRPSPQPALGAPGGILVGDAHAADDLDADAPPCARSSSSSRRTGVRVVTLPIRNRSGLAPRRRRPAGVVVVAGRHADDEEVARWAYAGRSVAGALAAPLFQRGTAAQEDGATRAAAVPTAGAARGSRRGDGAGLGFC